MTNVVVLGGSGFVGRSLCPALADAGYQVWSVSRSPVVVRDARVRYIDCNYDNIYQLGELYQAADTIFHLACDTTPATSSMQSSLEVTVNLLPTLRLLEYLEHECRCGLVYASSGGTIYGDVAGASDEQAAMSPISYYGASKASIELFLRAYHRQTENPVTILRPSNLYGPGQLAKQQFGIVPTLLGAIRDGVEFRLMGDGENRRDFVYIEDFIALCRAVLDQGQDNSCAVYNAGSGEGVTLNSLVRLAQKVTGEQVKLARVPARRVDVRSVVLDPGRARETFGWQAATDLESGLGRTWDWLTRT